MRMASWRRLGALAAGTSARAAVRSVSWWCRSWPPYSRLFLMGDRSAWVIDEEMQALAGIVHGMGIQTPHVRWMRAARRQAVFFGSQFYLLGEDWLRQTHRIGLAYFHGLPGTGYEEFDRVYQRLRHHHRRLTRIQVSHNQMHQVVLETGIDSGKVFQIPIGLQGRLFHPQTEQSKRRLRDRLGIPQGAFVLGSFQKDGVGWEEGLEPKLIKGPDIFLRAVEILKPRVAELHVLLSGPARGYVKMGLERLKIPYRHFYFSDYRRVAELYHALDVYAVASRQEGGPKAVLEAMASGVPLVSTRVGQGADLIRHGQNGHLVEVQDAEALAHWILWGYHNRSAMGKIRDCGLSTAAQHTYEAQLPLWRRFFDGFVETRE